MSLTFEDSPKHEKLVFFKSNKKFVFSKNDAMRASSKTNSIRWFLQIFIEQT